MLKFLEILLKVTLTILLVGITLVIMAFAVNESEIALMLAGITCYTVLPLLIIAVAIDVKIN